MTSYIRDGNENTTNTALMRHKTDGTNYVFFYLETNFQKELRTDITSVMLCSPLVEEHCVGVGHIHHSVIRISLIRLFLTHPFQQLLGVYIC